MLILSRQKNEIVRFPGLGIAVHILGIRGNKVRMGIDAPLEVRVLRDELDEREKTQAKTDREANGLKLPAEIRHRLRNVLHEIGLMLQIYHQESTSQPDRIEQKSNDAHREQMFNLIVSRLQEIGEEQPEFLKVNATQQRTTSTPQLPENFLSSTSQRSALIVDDDENERELLAGWLRLCDFHVNTSADGAEALSKLDGSSELPNVVLLDMQMPRCNGRDFLGELRASDRLSELEVFVISGSEPAEYGYAGNESDFTHWFQKPLDPRKLIGAMKKLATTPITMGRAAYGGASF